MAKLLFVDSWFFSLFLEQDLDTVGETSILHKPGEHQHECECQVALNLQTRLSLSIEEFFDVFGVDSVAIDGAAKDTGDVRHEEGWWIREGPFIPHSAKTIEKPRSSLFREGKWCFSPFGTTGLEGTFDLLIIECASQEVT